ncbi:MAG TPA: Asp-tRNA(Asn)/Glu-tRNA(Gln) amidotransferase subunit GatB [Candidatus Moranbacteria bacterium]|nr:Asp-tRNA(Asn)/Glu-tRNA(Gln) amidotransferase subunit GatB [Candidatus Moranbacteria bacterium]HRY28141.1 Asp-tRNA(Asn)/Glu-tRNA(Gln) amidotransferase subunit GatB [Candidatus Moranbacteria bacterium]HSA08456.1 Asp-tRNA(Asn)/Glu-tRNA(Gln) amidotransferase subunit GatB [Candidatus Moranbacteria bacterium]
MKYIPTIGMEIHVELKTDSKMFCSCKNALGHEKEPNIHICPVCTSQPGTLPVPNEQAIRFVQLAGLALNCELNLKSKFDRKNYFYPDLPKGYQISQYDQPLCGKGHLNIGGPASTREDDRSSTRGGKEIGITRIHLEEDTGKLIHPVKSDKSDNGASPKETKYTLVDYNRAGVPLMEMVTEPDIENGEQARIFCTKFQQICRYLNISDADMEKGNMRCEVNLSLHKEGEDKLSGTKVEVKNINSFKFVEKAINYEIERQTEVLEKGEKIIQETRGWDSVKNVTVSQRKKESAHDYRYFPEPDIPPMEFTQQYVEKLKMDLPELPDDKEKRFASEYGLNEKDVQILTAQSDLAEYFEQVVCEIKEKITSHEVESPEDKVTKLAVNYIISELRKNLMENNHEVRDLKITPENYAEFIGIVADGKINSSAAQTVLKEMYHTGGDPSQIIEEKNLGQMEDFSEIEAAVEKVIDNNEKSVQDYKSGKQNALQFLMGQVMKETGGKAHPMKVIEILKKKLG